MFNPDQQYPSTNVRRVFSEGSGILQVPGTFAFLGGAENKEKGIIFPHYHPGFDVDEDILPLEAALYVSVAMGYLGEQQRGRTNSS